MWDAIEGHKVARNESVYQIFFQEIGLEGMLGQEFKKLFNGLMRSQ